MSERQWRNNHGYIYFWLQLSKSWRRDEKLEYMLLNDF